MLNYGRSAKSNAIIEEQQKIICPEQQKCNSKFWIGVLFGSVSVFLLSKKKPKKK